MPTSPFRGPGGNSLILNVDSSILNLKDTIVAPSTAQGIAALAIVRLSGPTAIELAASVFKGEDLSKASSHAAHFGAIVDEDRIIDEVVVTVFREPHSYTGENIVEISCHGSPLIVKELVLLMIRKGARMADAGEFTRRAFLNGKMDLSQAEAVADLIHSETENARQAAVNQMRSGYAKELSDLRQQLITFASLIELELDFSEEDVEFAHREELVGLLKKILRFVDPLITSFAQGNVIKRGIPTVIAGKPNAGKSTLLNALLNEERAIVSEIPGTTRDTIEDEIILNGIAFRFIDTAGLRDTADVIESLGVERARAEMKKASLILYVIDLTETAIDEFNREEEALKKLGIPYLLVGNKIDRAQPPPGIKEGGHTVFISASKKENIELLKERITHLFHIHEVKPGDVLVTNLRHYRQLVLTREAIQRALDGFSRKITGEFIAQDIRSALQAMGEITGEVTTEDLLGEIFSKFCIGK